MTAVQTAPGPDATSAPQRRTSRRWLAAAGLALLAAVALRFSVSSPLWLDEAQTVAIAHRSLSGLFDALRIDGSPPAFYLLLHFWMAAFGTSTAAVRALPGLLGVACLPAAYLAARELGMARDLRWTAVFLFATNPFPVYYATQVRMYSLELLLSLLAVAVFARIWRAGASAWLVGAAALDTAALLLTHYWALFLYAVAGAVVLVLVVRGSRPARPVLLALLLAAVPFVPWAPTFVTQTLHTGAPWGVPAGVDTVLMLPLSWSGPGLTGKLLAGLTYVLLAIAVCGRFGDGLRFGRPVRRLPVVLLGIGCGAVLLATLASAVLHSAYAPRYSTIAVAPVLFAVALALAALPSRWRTPTLAVVVVLGLLGALSTPFERRTQADSVADRLHPAAGDLVVFCPDQLGPAVHRLAPTAGRQVVYPDFAPADLVNWTNYKERIDGSHPAAFVHRLLQLAAGHTIYLVYATDYKLFQDRCSDVATDLAVARGAGIRKVTEDTDLIEHESLVVFPPR